ncbi:mucin-3B-like [Grus americana]|uniref:mucin-3B-like n=1 Tax=Grus americana TaxID=9117 RepID=UPI00240848C1|nr:mucin-3B-like [Grus americana]
MAGRTRRWLVVLLGWVMTVICQNGGTYDGIKCLCTPYFYGDLCQFSTNSIETALPFPGTILANVGLVVTVTNFNYTEELQDTQSETYRNFEEHFRREIKKIYGNIPGYEGVKIISLKPGSIVVDHQIFFTMMNSSNMMENFEEITKNLVERLEETVANQGACLHNSSILCLTVSPNPIVRNMTETSSVNEICWLRAPSNYRDFYYLVIVEDVIHCITNCTPNMPTTMDCHYGQCHITRAGPQCFCQDEALYWYTGARCSGRVSKLATGLGLVATVLLIACIVLAVMLVRSRRRKYRLSDSLPYAGGNWYEEDSFTWHSPDGFLYRNMGAQSAVGEPQPQFGVMETNALGRPPRQPTAPRHHPSVAGEGPHKFTPSLELVDTSNPMKISRPKLTTQL